MKVTDRDAGQDRAGGARVVPSARRALSDGCVSASSRYWKLATFYEDQKRYDLAPRRPVAARHALSRDALRRVVGGRRAVRQEGQGQGEGSRGVRQGPLLVKHGTRTHRRRPSSGWHFSAPNDMAHLLGYRRRHGRHARARDRRAGPHRRLGDERSRAVRVAADRLGRAGPARLVARDGRGRAFRGCAGRTWCGLESPPSVSPARCTAPRCSTRKARSCARRCSGAISGPTRSAARSPSASARAD